MIPDKFCCLHDVPLYLRCTSCEQGLTRAPDGSKSLEHAAKTLAVLALQSERYTTDADYREAVDTVLDRTRQIVL